MGKISPEERPVIGQAANKVKDKLNELICARKDELAEVVKKKRMEEERIDITLPGTRILTGYAHPLSRITREIEEIFIGLGFTIEEGPEIETDYNNFEALNVPKYHPARDLQDTFYIDDHYLLRTHTSPVQVRTMARQKPPIRIIAPGRVYRSDEIDASHSPVFYQAEGWL